MVFGINFLTGHISEKSTVVFTGVWAGPDKEFTPESTVVFTGGLGEGSVRPKRLRIEKASI